HMLSEDRGSAAAAIREFAQQRAWEKEGHKLEFPHLQITRGAFPDENERLLGRYLYEVSRLRDKKLTHVLRFAAQCVLEDISYTRKDGQYLRWDARSGKGRSGKPFYKAHIHDFSSVIVRKLDEIAVDLSSDDSSELGLQLSYAITPPGKVSLIHGSCLKMLPW